MWEPCAHEFSFSAWRVGSSQLPFGVPCVHDLFFATFEMAVSFMIDPVGRAWLSVCSLCGLVFSIFLVLDRRVVQLCFLVSLSRIPVFR